ncbi:MAG: DMT family transporter, partial [Bacteroidota bacterium]
MSEQNRKWLYLIILSIVWGSSFILIKKGLVGLTPYQLGAVRTLITGFILLVFGSGKLRHITKSEWKWVIVSGFVGSFFPAFLFAIAQTEIDSAITSVLNSLVPLNAILLGFAIFGIGFTRKQMIGVIVGFVGTSILVLRGADVNPNQNYLYAGFVLIATIMYALNVN